MLGRARGVECGTTLTARAVVLQARGIFDGVLGRRVCICVLAAVLGAACGLLPAPAYEQAHSATQIVTDATAATGSAKSFHIRVDDKAKSGPAQAELDVEGSNVSGKITGQGISIRIMHVGTQTFIYGADLAAFLALNDAQAAASVRAKASDKWVLMPSDFWNSSFSDLIDMQKMSTCLRTVAGLQKKGTSTVDGEGVVELDDQLQSRLYVQTAAPHHFVRLVFSSVETCLTDSTSTGQTIDLSRYGTKFGISVPSGYVDIATLVR